MLRSGASRAALRSIGAPATRTAPSFRCTAPTTQWTTQFGTLASRRPGLSQLTPMKPVQSAVMRRGLTDAQKKDESRYAKGEIKPTPETVTATSSTHAMFGEVGVEEPAPQKDADMAAGLKADVATVRETFSLSEVPREAYYMGLAGTLPYLATSATTVFCAWEINNSNAGYGFLLNEKNATQLLHLLEPLQIGYGASILSFLGAIHWGLEWAGYGGYQSYKRYAIGVAAPAVAWSTLLMPIEGALITQFIGFVGLYYIDARATKRGWTPPWYRTYRFVLTGIVGASIVLTLVGRGELPDHIPGSVDRAKVFKGSEEAEERLSKDEEVRAQKKKNAAAADSRDGKKKDDKKEVKEEDKQENKDEGKDESREKKEEGKGEEKKDGEEAEKKDGEEEKKQDDKDGEKKEDKKEEKSD